MEQTKYSNEFKADALRLAESEGVKEASEKLGVRTRQIYDWRRTERLRQNKLAKKLHPGESLQEAIQQSESELKCASAFRQRRKIAGAINSLIARKTSVGDCTHY